MAQERRPRSRRAMARRALQPFTHSDRRQGVLGASRGGELAQTLIPIGGEQRQSFTREPRPTSPFLKLGKSLARTATRGEGVAPGSLVSCQGAFPADRSRRGVAAEVGTPSSKNRAVCSPVIREEGTRESVRVLQRDFAEDVALSAPPRSLRKERERGVAKRGQGRRSRAREDQRLVWMRARAS